jgi:hypothetical protein
MCFVVRIVCGSVEIDQALLFLLYHTLVPTVHVVAKRLGCDAFIGISMISQVSRVCRWVVDWFSVVADGFLPRILVIQDALLNNRLKAGSR